MIRHNRRRKYISYICLVALLAGWTVYRHYYLKPITCDKTEVLDIARDFAKKTGHAIEVERCRVSRPGFPRSGLTGLLDFIGEYYFAPRVNLKKRSNAEVRCNDRRFAFSINCMKGEVWTFSDLSDNKKPRETDLSSVDEEMLTEMIKDHAENLLRRGIINEDDQLISSRPSKGTLHFSWERLNKNTGQINCLYITTNQDGRLIRYGLSYNDRCIK